MRRLIATTTAAIALSLGVIAAATAASANVVLEPAAPESATNTTAQGTDSAARGNDTADLIALLGISSICPISANAMGCGVIM
ncbi:hypothetical protein NONO_c75590 [Nocardia nova SH22a]|uniref:Secreted protein n=1 Tax=Nocardia nova SH22a TaxID=1415166 RepID=W5TSY6_9NOCA|nr:hypothetical protein [Nocardia nova]AHH22314.1 hypothetical protein NONO_c75590 [Nocardia nova SH22a]